MENLFHTCIIHVFNNYIFEVSIFKFNIDTQVIVPRNIVVIDKDAMKTFIEE